MDVKTQLRILYITFFCLLNVVSKGQQNSGDMAKIISPSPNASSLGNFGNNSKSTYNGVPDIFVPVLNSNAAGQNINISLSYDASGTRAAQDASWVGLGWSLAYGGGVITRTVRGMDDLYSGGYHLSEALPTPSQLETFLTSGTIDSYLATYFMSVRTGQLDVEPDIFTFSFGGQNGKFVFDKTITGSEILQLESSNLKISYINPGWKIVDGNGNSYYFNTQETATDYSLTSDSEIDYDPSVFDLTDENLSRHEIITAWYLDSIITVTSQKISFTYTGEQSTSLLNKSEQKYTRLAMTSGQCAPGELNVFTAAKQLLYNKVPDQILFDNGSIEFHKSTRTDVKDAYGANGSSRLAYILEKDANGSIIKKIDFYQSYFNDDDVTGTNKRLKLDSIKDVTNSLTPLPPHKFFYSNPNSLPAKYTKAIDYWGYFNNQNSNTTLLPAATTLQPYFRSFAGSNRQPDTTLSSVQNGVLSSIIYPTGGSTNFAYELNEYTNLYGDDQYNSQDTTLSPGTLPPNEPDRTVSFTLTELAEVRFDFNYFDINNPYTENEFIDDYAFLYLTQQYPNGQPYFTFRNVQHINEYPYTIYNTSETLILQPGTYTMRLNSLNGYNTSMSAKWSIRTLLTQRKGGGLRVKRIENLDGLGNTTVKRFLYTNGSLSSGLLLMPVRYDYTFLLGGVDGCSNNLNAQYFTRYSNTINNEGFTKGGLIGYSKVTELSGEQGENGKVEYFFYNEAGPYLTMPSVPVIADPLNGRTTAIKYYDAANNLLKKIEYNYSTEQGGNPTSITGIKCLSIPFSTTGFYLTPYGNPSIWIKQTKETEFIYSGGDSLVFANNFYYENVVHKQLTKKEEQLSTGDIITTHLKYPPDLISAGIPNVYNAMSDRNMFNPRIEQSIFKNNSFLQSTRTNYDYWKSNSWGDPSANIIVPHTFDTKVLTNDYETRLRYQTYDSKGNILTVSKENGPKTCYLYSYGGQYPIAKIENAEYAAVESLVGGSGAVTAFRDQLFRTKAQIDAFLAPVRSNSNYQITTYTYSPLVGMTSETDPRGQTTYYEYDSFQRLSTVKDHNNNILKQYCYNYAGQQGTCYPITIPTAGSGGSNIYIRAELKNYTDDSGTDSNGYGYSHIFADLSFNTYSDAACTQPYVMDNTVEFNFSIGWDYITNTDFTSGSNIYSFTFQAGNSSAVWGNTEIHVYDEYAWDDDLGYLYDDYRSYYDLLDVPVGSGFVNINTYEEN